MRLFSLRLHHRRRRRNPDRGQDRALRLMPSTSPDRGGV
jgi:hypothetical protein